MDVIPRTFDREMDDDEVEGHHRQHSLTVNKIGSEDPDDDDEFTKKKSKMKIGIPFFVNLIGKEVKSTESIQDFLATRVFGKASASGNSLLGAEDEEGTDEYLRKKWCGLLHPDTKPRNIYDSFHLCVILYLLFILPKRYAFGVEPKGFWYGFDLFLDGTLYIDILINFRAYFYDKEARTLVTEKSVIVKRYLRSWFIIDVASVLPVDQVMGLVVLIMEATSDDDAGNSAAAEAQIMFRGTRLIRLARLSRVIKLLNLRRLQLLCAILLSPLGVKQGTVDFYFRIFVLVFIMLAAAHVLGCFWISLGYGQYESGEGWVVHQHCTNDYPDLDLTREECNEYIAAYPTSKLYVTGFYFALVTMSTVGYGDILPINPGEKGFAVLTMVVGAFVYAYIIGEFSTMINALNRDSAAFDTKMRSINELMHHLKVPEKISRKVYAHYDFKFARKTLFDQNEIFNEMPSTIRIELIKTRYKDVIASVPFFTNLRDETIVDICQRLHEYGVLPGEFIVEKGSQINEMVIMNSGKANKVIWEEEEQEYRIVGSYDSGSFFGEHQFLGLSEERTETIQAVQYCEVSSLRPQDIEDILDLNPALAKKLEIYATLQRKFLAGLSDPTVNKDQLKITLSEDLKVMAKDNSLVDVDLGTGQDIVTTIPQLQQYVRRSMTSMQADQYELREDLKSLHDKVDELILHIVPKGEQQEIQQALKEKDKTRHEREGQKSYAEKVKRKKKKISRKAKTINSKR